MNNSLAKLLACIEPKITNIGENRVELKSLNEVLKTMTELVELSKTSYLEILDYYDQDFIIRCLRLYNEETDIISKYKTSKYLLENQDNNMKDMPQYQEALRFMEFLINYLNELWLKIKDEYNSKSESLKIQELFNKYYLILKNENVFINDVDEFLDFLNNLDLSLEDRFQILLYVNKCNIKNYSIDDNEDMFVNDINFTDVKSLLEENSYLINKDYDFNFIEEDIIKDNKIDYDFIDRKKKYLLNKISKLFKTFEYDEITKYYKEYKSLIDYLDEFKKQELSFKLDKKLVFVMNKDKSLVREYIENCNPIYQGPIFKNLLDIEKDNEYKIPDYCYNGNYIYIKPEFVVKTIYTYLENGLVLILGVIDKKINLKTYLYKNRDILGEVLREKDKINIDNHERDLLLKDLTIDDLVMTIDLNTLDIKMEDKNAR